jgi:hypothetical protein
VQIYTPCRHMIFNFNCHLPQKLCASQHFIYGNLHLSVHRGITCGVHRCKYIDHAATFCSTSVMFSMKITHQLNITKGNSHLNLPSRNHMVEYESMNINPILPHHIQHQSHFPQKYASPGILSSRIFTQCSSRNSMVKSTDINIRTVMSYLI